MSDAQAMEGPAAAEVPRSSFAALSRLPPDRRRWIFWQAIVRARRDPPRQGDPLGWTRDSHPFLRRFPKTPLGRGLAVGARCTVALSEAEPAEAEPA